MWLYPLTYIPVINKLPFTEMPKENNKQLFKCTCDDLRRCSSSYETYFQPKWVDVLRLHDTVARFRTGVKFSPWYKNRGELTLW